VKKMKAIIITSQRSGSNFLRHCLESHPAIKCEGELLISGTVTTPKILEDFRWPAKVYRYMVAGAWNPVKILETFLLRNDAEVVAFKAMYNHVKNPKVLDFLRKHKEIRIIHLKRENLLKQYVSKMLLGKKREQRRWQPHSTKKLPPVSIKIKPKAAIRAMEKVQEQHDFFKSFLEEHPRIDLIYENMIEGQCLSDDASKSVCQILDIENRKMCCNFVKVNPDKIQLIVDNYDELVDALQGTAYERFLD
jgi:LPS sulfotransferase NodH